MKLVNLTPHPIHIYIRDQRIASIEPSGTVARAEVERVGFGHISFGGRGVPIYRSVFWDVQNLPDPEEGTRCIVSRIVAEACRDRTDLLIVDDTVRDEHGQIIGCRAFGVV